MSIKGRITRIVGAGLAAFSWPLLAAEADKLATTPIGLTGEAVGAAELMQVSIGLLVVLVVLGGLAWMLRRFNLHFKIASFQKNFIKTPVTENTLKILL